MGMLTILTDEFMKVLHCGEILLPFYRLQHSCEYEFVPPIRALSIYNNKHKAGNNYNQLVIKKSRRDIESNRKATTNGL